MPANRTAEEFFDEIVFGANGFMLRDVMREITRARADEPAGNFLAALGLLCYTEALGQFVPGHKRGAANRFDAFFRRMGPAYDAFADTGKPYDTFRNGMAHTYLVKGKCEVSMLADNPLPELCGVGESPSTDWLWFNVETYYTDFVRAADALHIELTGHRHSNAHTWGVALN